MSAPRTPPNVLRRRVGAHRRDRSATTSSASTSEDEAYVERSLPPSPAETYFPRDARGGGVAEGSGASSSSSRAYRFAMEDEAVLRHAAGAFDDEDDGDDDAAGGVGGWGPGDGAGNVFKREDEEDDVYGDVESEDELREGDPAAWERFETRARAHRGEAPTPELVMDLEEEADEEAEEEEAPDERQCRICFSGVEEQETLGRLISPCLCTGTMRYVHVQCINAWRGTGSNAKAFMECPQCHHRYTLRRTLVLGLATSRPILLLLSSLIFLLLTLSAGHILHRFVLPSSSSSNTGRALVRRRQLGLFDILHEDWTEFDNGVIINGGGVGGGTLIWDVVSASIDTFSSVAERFARARQKIGADGSWIDWMVFALGVRFLLGLAVLGSLSFLSLLLSLSLFAPFQLANGLRGTGVFNSLNRRARAARQAAGGGGGGGTNGTPAGQIMIILFVLVGAANTLVQVYALVRATTERALKYVETQILEVNPEDRRRARGQRRRERQAQWWRAWWSQGRWATRAGWEEVRVRLWMAARGGLGPVWERMWARDVPGMDGAGAGMGMGPRPARERVGW